MTLSNSAPITVLGGPDAGKSNYIGALWMKLRRNRGVFRIPFEPDNIEYVERIVRHLRVGQYPPRTEPDEGDATFVASISRAEDPKVAIAQLSVPDMKGEVWKAASKDREIDPAWIRQLGQSAAAMLFVRLGSEENVDMIDWIASAQLMELDAARENNAKEAPSTQLFLCDLLNLLEDNLGTQTLATRPRVALMIAAWDCAGAEERENGPRSFIRNEYPMLYGRIADNSRLEIKVFGVSATGYDLKVPEQRDAYLKVGPAEAGFAEVDVGDKIVKGDLLTPLTWALEGEIA
jgi:hypothetical protein